MNAFLRTITGKNKTGKILGDILLISPIPNIFKIFKLAISEKIEPKNMPKFVWQKLDKAGLTTSIISLSIGLAVVKGYLTMEEAKLLIEFLTSIL